MKPIEYGKSSCGIHRPSSFHRDGKCYVYDLVRDLVFQNPSQRVISAVTPPSPPFLSVQRGEVDVTRNMKMFQCYLLTSEASHRNGSNFAQLWICVEPMLRLLRLARPLAYATLRLMKARADLNTYRQQLSPRSGGDVPIAAGVNIDFSPLHVNCDFEVVFARLSVGHRKLVLGACYSPPCRSPSFLSK